MRDAFIHLKITANCLPIVCVCVFIFHWKAAPAFDIQSLQSLPVFPQRLKAFLFLQSFPNIAP